LSLVFNVIFTYVILGKSTSFLTCSTLLVVIVGFVCGIQGEIDFSMVGTAAGVLSSVFVSLNSIYTARILPVVDNDKSMLLYYNNLNATVLFIPLIFLFETDVRTIFHLSVSFLYSAIISTVPDKCYRVWCCLCSLCLWLCRRTLPFHVPCSRPAPCSRDASCIFRLYHQIIMRSSDKLISAFFWFSMCVTGIMGFAIGLVTVMQVKATSPLTHNISGTAKAAVQVSVLYVRTLLRSCSTYFVEKEQLPC
jgi:hypothetical protein